MNLQLPINIKLLFMLSLKTYKIKLYYLGYKIIKEMITTNVKTVVTWCGWKDCDCRKGQGGFWGAYNILFLNIDDGYMGVQLIIILYDLCSLLYTC